jgi:hypothetical protein
VRESGKRIDEGAPALSMKRSISLDFARKLPCSRMELIVLGSIIGLHLFITFQGIGELYLEGHQGWNAALRSTIARNYLRYGLVETGLKPLKNFEPLPDPRKGRVHWHHPPGVNLAVAASFAVFGPCEAAARIVPVAASLVSFAMLYLIARRRHGVEAALASVAIFSLLPMQVEYGKMVNYEPVVLALGLIALELLERRRAEQRGSRRLLLAAGICAALCAAGFVDWPAFLIAGLLGVDALLRRPRQPLVFVLLALTTCALLLFLLWWLGKEAGPDGIMKLARMRGISPKESETFGRMLEVVVGRFQDYYGTVPLFAGAVWVAVQALRRRLDPVLVVFAGFNLIYIILFRQGARIHNFFIYYFTPAIALCAGVGIVSLARWIPSRKLGLAIAASWSVFFLAQELQAIPPLHERSYGILPPRKKSLGFPFDGRLDRSLVARQLHDMTEPGERVLFHSSIKLQNQMLYYLDRSFMQVKTLNPPTGYALFVASERRISRDDQARLAGKYPVLRMMAYLIYDLQGIGPRVRTLRFEERPFSVMHWYLGSSFYPPFTLVEDWQAAARYAKDLGIGT